MQHQQELESKLWEMANTLRGTMEAYEFKKLHSWHDFLLLPFKKRRRLHGKPLKR